MAARWSGVAPAVPSSQWSTGGTGAAGAKPANSGSGGRSAAAANARSTSASRLVASVRVVCARATLPSTATVSDIASRSSVTFWWMRLLANRVNDDVPTTAAATASPRPATYARARSHASVASRVESASSTIIRTVV
jgi:hypothetical protein